MPSRYLSSRERSSIVLCQFFSCQWLACSSISYSGFPSPFGPNSPDFARYWIQRYDDQQHVHVLSSVPWISQTPRDQCFTSLFRRHLRRKDVDGGRARSGRCRAGAYCPARSFNCSAGLTVYPRWRRACGLTTAIQDLLTNVAHLPLTLMSTARRTVRSSRIILLRSRNPSANYYLTVCFCWGKTACLCFVRNGLSFSSCNTANSAVRGFRCRSN